ncbi:hypothetical protein IQ07DRAFT_164322 [Pyrenochaeta sp. DS3sAY3a]|nr:hypothetical protein IQ07DRAFT_164322 [Pyrenochaeta sp. DS3sAY3a]
MSSASSSTAQRQRRGCFASFSPAKATADKSTFSLSIVVAALEMASHLISFIPRCLIRFSKKEGKQRNSPRTFRDCSVRRPVSRPAPHHSTSG